MLPKHCSRTLIFNCQKEKTFCLSQYSQFIFVTLNVFSLYDDSTKPNHAATTVCEFQKTAFTNAQLENLKLYATEPISNARELVTFLQSMTQSQKRFLPQVVVLAKLLLVMPATNAVSERSFSALKRVKTYLRATTTNKRLNHLMLLHIHKEKTDSLNLVDVANFFSS